MGTERGLKPSYIFSAPFNPPPFQKLAIAVHPIVASLMIRFFFSLISSNQHTDFCNLVAKENKIAKTVGIPNNFVSKALKGLL